MAWLFLMASLVGAAFTYAAYRPIFAPARLAVVSFFAGWLTTELALHHIAWQALFTLGFVWAGALRAWPGKLGMLIAVISWLGLWRRYWQARDAEVVVEKALQAGLGADYRRAILPQVSGTLAPNIDWRQIARPLCSSRPGPSSGLVANRPRGASKSC